MKEVILKLENISKQYRLGTLGTGTISHDLNRWWHKIKGKEDPYLKIGETNDRSTKGDSEYVWALKDVSFDVKKGEVLGIIGKNGAGKSTLLKILSKVTGPSTGSIKSRGRIASLLEVGTGFHPEMTGRENIYLNGAILGMTKKEINSKIAEIIEFSGCERYIDTPTKRYSSGMTVRLAFAVAAFLEPDVLVVDEVLAVGDAEFQKKAIGKMQDISNTDGRTVLFVSHNMPAVKSLCTRCIVLENGTVSFEGSVDEAIDCYINQFNKNIESFDFSKRNIDEKSVYFTDFKMIKNNIEETFSFAISDPISIKINLRSLKKINVTLRVVVFDINESRILAFDSKNTNDVFSLDKGDNTIECLLDNGLEIKPNQYYVNISVRNKDLLLDHIVKVNKFNVVESDYYNSGKLSINDMPLVLKKNKWKFN